jgi:hypothetical protein
MRPILLVILGTLLISACSVLLSESKYVRVDDGLQVEPIWSGILFTIPEKRGINKIVLLGEGHIRNIEVHARVSEDEWKIISQPKTLIEFPYEIQTYGLKADAIRILQKTMAGKGRIITLQLYKI